MCHEYSASTKDTSPCRRGLTLKIKTISADADFLESFHESDIPVTLVRCRSEGDIAAGNNIPGLKSIARLWRKDSTDSGSQTTSPLRKLQVRGCSPDMNPIGHKLLSTKKCEKQQLNAGDIKERWRNQQIANQVKLADELKISWTSWLIHRRSPLHFLRSE